MKLEALLHGSLSEFRERAGRLRIAPIPKHYPTTRDRSVQLRTCGDLAGCYAGRANQASPNPLVPTSTCHRIGLQRCFDEVVWRYAAGLAGSAEICRSAY